MSNIQASLAVTLTGQSCFCFNLHHFFIFKLFCIIAVTPGGIVNDISRCWNAIVTRGYSKKGKYWSLNDNVEWIGEIDVFYNREAYDELIDILNLNAYPKYTKTLCLITGSPGIGKTLFLLAVLVAIVENAVINDVELPSINYIRKMNRDDPATTWSLFPDGSIDKWDERKNPDYLLSDSTDIMVPYGNVLNLEVASDKERNYNNFRKRITEAKKREKSRVAIERVN